MPLAMAQYADVTAVRAHAIAHRYPVESETLRDQQTWHVAVPSSTACAFCARQWFLTYLEELTYSCWSQVALEWSHGQFLTLVELAWLNGIGGYGGQVYQIGQSEHTKTSYQVS